MYVCIHIYIYIYVYMHIYIYIYIYTCSHAPLTEARPLQKLLQHPTAATDAIGSLRKHRYVYVPCDRYVSLDTACCRNYCSTLRQRQMPRIERYKRWCSSLSSLSSLSAYQHIYIYIYIYMYIHTYTQYTCVCIYIYIYIYM